MDFHLTPTKFNPETNLPTGFSVNGVFRRYRENPPPAPVPVIEEPVMGNYKECLKNHAASMGGHALDGCGEFMPTTALPFSASAANSTDPTSLKCAACGCHRNFHRRETDDRTTIFNLRHLQLPSPTPIRSSGVPILPGSPLEKTYYSSAALKPGTSGLLDGDHHHNADEKNSTAVTKRSKKRVRTKLSTEQKQKLYAFSEKMGWKMSNKNGIYDEKGVNDFCNEIGISKSVLKVWMHNNKNTFALKFSNNSNYNFNYNKKIHHEDNEVDDEEDEDQIRVSTNGSSVSS